MPIVNINHTSLIDKAIKEGLIVDTFHAQFRNTKNKNK
jgi:hypothetical protein